MTRVLWVSSEPPDFQVGGGSIRQAHLLAGLSRRVDSVELMLAGRLSDPQVRDLLSAVTELEVAPPLPHRSVGRRRLDDLWKALVVREPAEVHDRRRDRAALGRALSRLVPASSPGDGSSPYDIVHVEHLGLAGIVPAGLGRQLSMDVQNVPSRMAAQAAPLAAGRRQRLLLRAEESAGRRFEAASQHGLDLLSVVSAADAADLGATRGAGRPVVVIVPNGVDPARFPVAPLPPEPRLVFTGTLDFLPNVEGIRWFVREVLPRVRAEVPGATLDIVGRRPTDEVRALDGHNGVRLWADVPDVALRLAAARVAVVPVRIGTGSRLKALEAMAAGRPVAGTVIGLEGIDCADGRQALVAGDAVGLAAAVVRLCLDDALAAAVGGAGRVLVEERYTWTRIGEDFAAGMLGLLA